MFLHLPVTSCEDPFHGVTFLSHHLVVDFVASFSDQLSSLSTDRSHVGAADGDEEAPRISLQEMLEDLTLADAAPVSHDPHAPVPDSAEMMSE